MRPPYRLAFREEGRNWNAYCAKTDTMQDAIWLGSIAMRFIENSPERKRIFMELMKEALSDVMEELCGVRPEWPEPEGHPAPEHEKTKSA